MAGASGPLGTSGSDMAGGPCGKWGCLVGDGRTGEGRWREWGGRGRFFLLLSLPNSRAEFANSRASAAEQSRGPSD